MLRSDIVKEYLTEWPDVPSLTLARMIYRENTSVFSGVEAVRNSIRLYRDVCGDKNRRAVKDKSFANWEGKLSPFNAIPEGLKAFDDWSPYNIEGEKILVLADPHIPYHNKDALQMALEYGHSLNVDTVLLLGDWNDHYAVSFWEKDPRKRDFESELETSKRILGIVRDAFPSAKIIYDLGNHEERYDRYMRVKAPELLGVKQFKFESIMELDKFNIEIIGDKRIIKIGRLHCIHGHEFGRSGGSPVNPARWLYLRGKETALCAHFHQSSQHTETTMSGDVISTWSVGCLSDLHPDWLPINKWNLGFAVVQRFDELNFRVDNKRIINAEIW